MASNSETGHAKNVANFDELIVKVSGLGPDYNPSQVSISASALQAVSASAHNAVREVKAALPIWSGAVAAREVAFSSLNSTVTRIMNALKASGVPEQVLANARTIARKIQGARATRRLTPEEKQAANEKGAVVNQISSSQMSYDSRISNLDGLVLLLASISSYVPNEPELKTDALKALTEDLKQKNNAVIIAATPLNNARILRNQVLYKTKTGLVDTALMAKAYVKSVYGATSPTYKMISKLSFKTTSLS